MILQFTACLPYITLCLSSIPRTRCIKRSLYDTKALTSGSILFVHELSFLSSPKRPDRLLAHPASYSMGSEGSFPVGKSGPDVKLNTRLHLDIVHSCNITCFLLSNNLHLQSIYKKYASFPPTCFGGRPPSSRSNT